MYSSTGLKTLVRNSKYTHIHKWYKHKQGQIDLEMKNQKIPMKKKKKIIKKRNPFGWRSHVWLGRTFSSMTTQQSSLVLCWEASSIVTSLVSFGIFVGPWYLSLSLLLPMIDLREKRRGAAMPQLWKGSGHNWDYFEHCPKFSSISCPNAFVETKMKGNWPTVLGLCHSGFHFGLH